MVLNYVLALLPIIWLFVAFLVLKLPGHIGCLIALLIAVAESVIFKLAGFNGILTGLAVGEALHGDARGRHHRHLAHRHNHHCRHVYE